MSILIHKGVDRDYYSYKFQIRGRLYKRSIPEARNKRQAEQVEALARQAVYEGRYLRFAGTISFEKFVNEIYKEWAKHKRSYWMEEWYCDMLTSHPRFKGKLLEEFSEVLIQQFRMDRKAGVTRCGTPRSLNTINREMACLRKILEIAVGGGYLDRNPAVLVPPYRVEGRRSRITTLEEDQMILVEAFTGFRARVLPIAVIARYCGMRRGEIVALSSEMIDFESRNIHLPKEITKTQTARDVPMCQTVFDVLKERVSNGLIFAGYPGKQRISGLFTEGVKALGIRGVTLHTLRHTFATQLEEIGVRQKEIRDIIGHKPKDMTEHYQHSTPATRRKAIEILEEADPLARGIENLEACKSTTTERIISA